MTRRDFIQKVACASGSAYAALRALNLQPPSPTHTLPQRQGEGGGHEVVILGAGVAGMSAAYELRKIGYACTVLEAKARPGGRCWTVRGGTTSTETDGTTQTAAFDDGLYINPGPARIPQHHTATIDYCREFDIDLEVFNNDNESAYYYIENEDDDCALANRPVRAREVETDLRGYAAELLAKSINQDALDVPLSEEDAERMVDYLRREGGLSPDLFYNGSTRRGYTTPPGAWDQPGEMAPPFDLDALIRCGFGDEYSDAYSFNQQPTMFQPVGGMDRIAYGFAERVNDMVEYEAVVDGIYKEADGGVRVTYQDADGAAQALNADYCICTIPLSVLQGIPNNLSEKKKQAIRGVFYAPAAKIGLQFSERFWETEEAIYGGVTRTNMDITQIWYPCSDYFAKKGVLLGYYTFNGTAVKVSNRSPAERTALALRQGRKIHPQYDDYFENAFSIAWHRMPYQKGGWASYTDFARETFYPRLIEPDGPIYLAGEHTSYLPGWMAGAIESAHRVVDSIHSRVLNADSG